MYDFLLVRHCNYSSILYRLYELLDVEVLSWPWNVGQRSLKVIESGTVWKFGYGFLTFPTLTLTLTLTGVKVIENGAVR